MRFNGLAIVASIITLGACAAGAEQGSDSAAPAGAATGGQATPTGETAQLAPITGTTHDVRMLFDGARYYFEPANLTIKQGDGVRWIMVSGAPHNVQFLPAEMPAGAEAQLAGNMPRPDAPLTGPMLLNENEEYIVSFANVPTGTYGYVCTPHQMMGMKGSIEVE